MTNRALTMGSIGPTPPGTDRAKRPTKLRCTRGFDYDYMEESRVVEKAASGKRSFAATESLRQ